MNKKERFQATIERRPVDRPAFWLGLPVAGAIPALLRHFGAADLRDLYVKADDDVYPIEFGHTKNGRYRTHDTTEVSRSLVAAWLLSYAETAYPVRVPRFRSL